MYFLRKVSKTAERRKCMPLVAIINQKLIEESSIKKRGVRIIAIRKNHRKKFNKEVREIDSRKREINKGLRDRGSKHLCNHQNFIKEVNTVFFFLCRCWGLCLRVCLSWWWWVCVCVCLCVGWGGCIQCNGCRICQEGFPLLSQIDNEMPAIYPGDKGKQSCQQCRKS